MRDGAQAEFDGEARRETGADRLQGDLSRLIEQAIIPRLMLVHGRSPSPESLRQLRPTIEEIDVFCARLLDPHADDLVGHVLGLPNDGRSLETLLVHLLAPAARQIGEMWERDECDFLDVTLAVGRLQAVTRELCARFERHDAPSAGRSILLSPCPGETHTFALSIVASFFRQSGWTVATAPARPDANPLDLAGREWFDVVGLSLSCDVFLPALAEAIRVLRRTARNPNLRILVGGPLFRRNPEAALLIGADAAADDGRLAPQVAESLLEKYAAPC